jgi:cellulose biosynthesis protein BcsQ
VALRPRRELIVRRSATAALPRLGVVPADERLADEAALVDPERSGRRLARSLAAACDGAALAVLDTPPGLAGLTATALVAADAVVMPAPPDYLAMDGLRGAVEAVRRIEKLRGSRYRPLAILPTFVEPRRRASQAALAVLRERFGALVMAAEIPRSARFDTAALAGVPLVVAARSSTGARAYRAAAGELAGALGEPVSSRGKALRAYAQADVREAMLDARRQGSGATPDG